MLAALPVDADLVVSLGNDKFKRCRCRCRFRDEGDGIVENVPLFVIMGDPMLLLSALLAGLVAAAAGVVATELVEVPMGDGIVS
jgi:hypothetical protein